MQYDKMEFDALCYMLVSMGYEFSYNPKNNEHILSKADCHHTIHPEVLRTINYRNKINFIINNILEE